MSELRIRLTVEREAMIAVDPKAVRDHFSGASTKRIETEIEKLVAAGHGPGDLWRLLGEVTDGFADSGLTVLAELQKWCERHDHWYELNVSKGAECGLCRDERLKKQAEERARKSAAAG